MVIEINAELYRLQHSPFISNFAPRKPAVKFNAIKRFPNNRIFNIKKNTTIYGNSFSRYGRLHQ